MNTPTLLLLLLLLTGCGNTYSDAEADAARGFELVDDDPTAATNYFLSAAVAYRNLDSLKQYCDLFYSAARVLRGNSANMGNLVRLLSDVYEFDDQVHPSVARAYGLLAHYYPQAGSELQALDAYRKSYESYPAEEWNNNVLPIVYYAGNLIRLGDNEQAIGLLTSHEHFLTDTAYKYPEDALLFYNEFSIAYWDQGKKYTEEGLRTVKRGLDFAQKHQLDTFPHDYARLLLIQANLHVLNEDASAASASLEQVKGFKPVGGWSPDNEYDGHIYLPKLDCQTDIYLLQKDYTRAQATIQEAIEGQTIYSQPQSIKRELAKFQLTKAEILRKTGDYQAAISTCQNALQSVLPNYRSEENDLPSPTLFYAENTIVEALHLLGQSAADQYAQNRSPELLNLAINAYRDAEAAELILLDRLTFTTAQLAYLGDRQQRHSEYLNLLLLSQENGTDRTEEVYRIMAENHAYVLRRELTYQNTLSPQQRQDNAPILRRFQGFTDSIGILDLELQQPGLSSANYQQILVYKTDLYERRAVSQKILDKVLDTPSSAIGSTFGSLATYQASLDRNTLAIHFFPGENGSYFRLSVDRKRAEFQALSIDPELLTDFTNLLTTSNRTRLDQDVASNLSFLQGSSQIYRQLFGQSELSPTDYRELRVYPAGKLNQLPFEALYPGVIVENKVINDRDGFRYLSKDLGFIGKNTVISYHHAVIDVEPTEPASLNFLTLLPEYDCPAWDISSTSQRVNQHMGSYSSSILEGNQLIGGKFKPDFSRTNATLFYGHFFANPDDPLNGYFALACPDNSGSGQGRLPVRDLLSGEPLNQDIFIVAGCGSGRGKEIPGEGIDNLERLLLSKGVRHVVTAHWDINQEATALFLENFIEAMNAGEAMSSAFHRAQRELIEEHPVYSHPYYWAGLRLVSKV